MQRPHGFTVIELIVVLAAISLLLSVVAPRYAQHLDRARDTALRNSLWQLRDAIDKFHADQSRYPAGVDELVARRYLRSLPVDPVTQRADTWQWQAPAGAIGGGVAEVRSGAPGVAMDGSSYASW